MGRYVVGLADVGRGDVEQAGGKGANLGEMIRAGFPVPPGFVVPAGVCREFFHSIGLDELIPPTVHQPEADPAENHRRIQKRILDSELHPDMVRDILKAHADLQAEAGAGMVCAVRSSATAEDMAQASFAGQHETYYYVRREQLIRMIQHCWASLWRPEAVSYRNAQGMDHRNIFMAVIVQQMILSDVSGVTFTINPVNGSADEIVIDSTWGMGAAIVDGRVTPDHFVLTRKGPTIKERRIAHKNMMVPPVVDGDGEIRLVEVPPEKRRMETLGFDQVREAARWGIRAEEYFGKPQDMEWAVFNDRFFVLQSRPVTMTGPVDVSAGVDGRWVIFKPVVENFTDPLTPLMCDLMSRLLSVVPGIRLIKGWLYVSVPTIKEMLPFKASDQELVKFIYEFGKSPPKMKLSLLKLPKSLLVGTLFHLLTGIGFSRVAGLPDDFMDQYRDLARRVDEDEDIGPYQAILRLWSWPRFFDPIGCSVVLVNLISGQYMVLLGVLRFLIRRWAPGVPPDAESILCTGVPGVYSAEMGREIRELAEEARRDPELTKLLQKKPSLVLWAKMCETPGARRFVERLNQFLGKFGHRGLKELELRSQRWEENPVPVLGMIRNYMLIDSEFEDQDRKTEELRRNLHAEIHQKLESLPLEKCLGWRRFILHRLTVRVRYYSKTRENSRYYHIMGFYIARKKILRIEQRLMAEGRLKCKDDIFFLTLDEIEALRAGRFHWRDLEDRIHARRLEYVRLGKTTPPKTIGLPELTDSTAKETDVDDGLLLRGQPASPGRYEGTAHVILDPGQDIELKPGEILVAPYTDPAWTPLFLTAGAAVVQVGSYLSHAGTVAREYGMPCVVDVEHCIDRIQTGDRILVDGAQGLVRLLDLKNEVGS